MPKERPLPDPDPESLPWWEALERRELLLQQCDDCRRYRWPPRSLCGECASWSWQWVSSSGRGTVASWTVTHPSGSGAGEPYTVLLVRSDEQDDIYFPGDWDPGADGSRHIDLTIGAPVVAGFEEVLGEDGRTATILTWRPAPS